MHAPVRDRGRLRDAPVVCSEQVSCCWSRIPTTGIEGGCDALDDEGSGGDSGSCPRGRRSDGSARWSGASALFRDARCARRDKHASHACSGRRIDHSDHDAPTVQVQHEMLSQRSQPGGGPTSSASPRPRLRKHV